MIELSPWMTDLIQHYGFWALMFISFVAATILPFSSEAALTLGILSGISIPSAVIACSIGNCAACSVNYGIGAVITTPQKIKKSKSGSRAYNWMKKYGWSSLLLSWLPVVGDPLTIVAGVFRINLTLFIAVVFALRIIRYLILAYFLR